MTNAAAEVKRVQEAIAKAEAVDLSITSPDPMDTHVDLVVGYVGVDGSASSATVRELNGEDEEYISRLGTAPKALQAIYHRGVEKLGSMEAVPELLERLSSADREAILLKIRQVTFGDEVELFGVGCPSCGAQQDVLLKLSEDVPSKKFDGVEVLDLKLSAGRAIVALPTAATVHKVSEATVAGKTSSEGSTIFLAGCVQSIAGNPVLGEAQIRKLSIRDRQKLLREIEKKVPGPRLEDVSAPCGVCGAVMGLPLALAQLFRF